MMMNVALGEKDERGFPSHLMACVGQARGLLLLAVNMGHLIPSNPLPYLASSFFLTCPFRSLIPLRKMGFSQNGARSPGVVGQFKAGESWMVG